MVDVVVVGQVARDLVLAVDELPDGSGSTLVTERREVIGGAVNQAVATQQLGCSAALVGVVGDDEAGRLMLDEARHDGLDTAYVSCRSGATTALFIDIVESDGTRRLLEHVPREVRLTIEDVDAARPALSRARAVLVQLAQPAGAVLAAVDGGAQAGALVVLDGAPEDEGVVDAALARADIVRADATEAAKLARRELHGIDDVVAAATRLLSRGPSIVALAAAGAANVVAWPGGHVVIPLIGNAPVDPTGGGDAFVAGLVTALLQGEDPETAAWWASAAAALTVQRLGGRPDLNLDEVAGLARGARERWASG